MPRRKTFVLFVSLFLLALGVAVVAQQEPPVVPRTALRGAIAAQERHTDELMLNPDVVGTAVGVGADGRGVVKLFVKRGDVPGLPRSLDGIPVAVEVSGEILARSADILARKGPPAGGGADPTARFPRPVPIGVSTGHPAITAGTIGCRVTDGTNVYALSNNHVYADENRATNGDNVLQPGAFDGGVDPNDAIGTLFDFRPIEFSTSANNTIDAAIALSSTANLGNATPSNGYGTPRSTTSQAAVGLRVMKYGRTTSQTTGRIDAINATLSIQYDSGVARFVNQIIILPGSFSAGGDSGSLIVIQRGTDVRKPVGLLFAGSQTFTVANPIDAVLGAFGVTVDGSP